MEKEGSCRRSWWIVRTPTAARTIIVKSGSSLDRRSGSMGRAIHRASCSNQISLKDASASANILTDLIYGVSVTDPCIGWDETVRILRRL